MKIKPITIKDKKIGAEYPPFIIAEMSGNHNNSLDRAFKIIDAAISSGVDAIKIQTYTADTLTIDVDKKDFLIDDPNSLWNGKKLYDLYNEASTPWEWHQEIFDYCNKKGIICFSSPFDASAVDFLEELNVPCYKIASFEAGDLELVKKVAKTGRPLIISTGMSTLESLDLTVRTARENGCKDLILLKCTSSYPATPESTNISTISHMRELFQTEVGLSDHTLGIGVACASISFGCSVIEKHFTLDRNDGGVDSDFSLEPHEFKSLVEESKRAWLAQGKVFYGPTNSEKGSLTFKRSLYICENMKAGDKFDSKNLRSIRPGFGLEPKYLDKFMGKKVNQDIEKGTPLSWDLI